MDGRAAGALRDREPVVPSVTVLIAFGATWGDAAAVPGLGDGGPVLAAFARERLRRLGVPMLVGLLTLVPLQVYLGPAPGR